MIPRSIPGESIRRARALCAPLFFWLALAGCTDDNPDAAELQFSGQQQALPGFSHDTGYQPSGSPIQVRLVLSADGKLSASAQGSISDTALLGTAGSGLYSLSSRVKVKVYLKLFVAGKKYEGPLAGAPDVELSFGQSQKFDPFLLGGKAQLRATVPETRLATINLAGALSAIPGVKGDLVISGSGVIDSTFSGVCATVQGDLAQYTGKTSTSGTLTLEPSVVLNMPLGVSKKLDAFPIKVPIPAVVAAMDLGTRSISGGTAGRGPCSGSVVDGGRPDGKQPADGAADSGPPPVDGAADSLPTDGPPPEQSCVTGTPDNCAHCGDKCGGPDDTATKRVCESGSCTIHCKGQYYDVNGVTKDGCETLDTNAAYDSDPTARDLGSASDCDSVKKAYGTLPSDGRYHLQAPHDRKLGTPLWFKLAIADKALCSLTASTTVDFASLPKGATYGVTAHFVCKSDSKKLKSTKKSTTGGQSVTLNPDTNCKGTDDSGVLYVRVQKEQGDTVHSALIHALSITP